MPRSATVSTRTAALQQRFAGNKFRSLAEVRAERKNDTPGSRRVRRCGDLPRTRVARCRVHRISRRGRLRFFNSRCSSSGEPLQHLTGGGGLYDTWVGLEKQVRTTAGASSTAALSGHPAG